MLKKQVEVFEPIRRLKFKHVFIVLFFISLLLIAACSKNNEAKEEEKVEPRLSGIWSGQIDAPPVPLEFTVNFTNDEELTGELSIPIQNLIDYPLSNFSIKGDSISFDMELPQETVNFEGEFKNDELIEGTFTQRGQSFPFHLQKGELAKEDDEEDVNLISVETEHGTLKGELVVPEGKEQYPIVLIIPGSGPTDRNGNSAALPGRNDSLKLLAEALAEEGIASVRYSKRGAGENLEAIIPEEDLRFEDFVNDAVSWLQLLKNDDTYTRVGVIGHSQGALTGLLAAKQVEVDAYVSIAGAGRPIGEVLREQLSNQLPKNLLKESEEILASLEEGHVVEEISEALNSVFRPEVQPFLISWMAYDPVKEISSFEVPTLIVQGGNDIQVSEENAKLLAEAKIDADTLTIVGMNHVLKEAPEDPVGNMQTYSNPDLPLSDGLVSGIVEFFERVDFK